MAETQDAIHNQFLSLLGKSLVSAVPADLEEYGQDWTKFGKPNPRLILWPTSTEEVSACLRLASEKSIAVVPSGGRTGLAGGAMALAGEIVLSLSKMNAIKELDTETLWARVESGVVLETLQNAAKDAGRFFGLDLAAKGSCQIGGNIATNAGGLRFIRYGGMREQLLGLKAVLADGCVISADKELRKNNSGYDLTHLFCGSEGTLGVITEATLKLLPSPEERSVLLLGCENMGSLLQILSALHTKGWTLSAFEFYSSLAERLVLSFKNLRKPFRENFPYYALVEVEVPLEKQSALESTLESIFARGIALDGLLAIGLEERRAFWSIRESITETLPFAHHVRKNDVSVPLHRLDEFSAFLENLSSDSVEVVLFGHIGDGNVHVNYIAPKASDRERFHEKVRELELLVFAKLQSLGGSLSAEHGIGLLKKADLHFVRSPLEISLMKKMKAIFDPKGLLNPGKVF